MTELEKQKKEYRARYSEYRKSLSEELRHSWNTDISARLICTEEYRTAKTVLIYCASKYEVDTKAIVADALAAGKRVAMPCSFPDGTMLFRYVSDPIKDLCKGAFGIYEPCAECKEVQDFGASVCIVPGLVFDMSGNRLGYGRGYYDRFLREFSGAKIGLAYSGCVTKHIPCGELDVRLNKIVFPEGEINL